MKKLKYLVLLLALVLILPFAVYAEGEEGEGEPVVTNEEGSNNEDNTDQRAIVYFFRGDGCPHCQDAETWFASIQEEYGSKFVIKDYETWNNAENAELMTKVAEVRNDNATGVPYIIIGDKSWIGFDEGTMADEIKAQIDQVYAQPVNERVDSLALVGAGDDNKEEEKSKSSDIVGLIVILAVAGLAGFGIYKARQHENN